MARNIIRKSTLLNFFPRIAYAMSYYNHKYIDIIKWGFASREDTNYTYNLTSDNLLYLANTIAVVCKKPLHQINDYICEAQNNKALIAHVVQKTRQSHFIAVADLRCDFGRRLGWYAFARALKPSIIVETGVDKGLGSALLCSALLRNREEGYEGKYYGTDIDRDAGYLLDGKYKEVGEILYGDSIRSLKELECKIDLFINDSDHSAEYEYMEYLTIQNKLSNNAVILGDNSHATNKLALFSVESGRNYLFFHEVPENHWYPGAGIGISFKI
jgi:predicted O-methyltransferase YrrM